MKDEQDDWFSEDMATFGDRVAAAREHTGLSADELAKKLGIKLGTLRNWEDDLNEPRANKLQLLSGVLGVSMRWLLTGEGDGISAPSEGQHLPADVQTILLEMRELRGVIVRSGERLGLLEKRLRNLMKDPK
jgi:transcriptional regulator with XRE-family HTH domain